MKPRQLDIKGKDLPGEGILACQVLGPLNALLPGSVRHFRDYRLRLDSVQTRRNNSLPLTRADGRVIVRQSTACSMGLGGRNHEPSVFTPLESPLSWSDRIDGFGR